MHRSAIALLLSAALSNAAFLTPSRGESLTVNQGFSIQWETEGLQEPLSINLVPSGPDDFVVAQQVGLDIANSGELEFIPDFSIANFASFQLTLSDAAGTFLNSEPFSIDGLTQEPVLATVTLQEVQTIVQTADSGSVITEFATTAVESVASVPVDPIRLAVSGVQTVNEALTALAGPVVNQRTFGPGFGGFGPGYGGGFGKDEPESSFPPGFDLNNDGIDDGQLDLIPFGSTVELLNPGDPGFVQINNPFLPLNTVGDGSGGTGGGISAGVLLGGGGGGSDSFQIQTAPLDAGATPDAIGFDGAVQFTPLATEAASIAVNTLLAPEPAAATLAPLVVGGDIGEDGALTVDPLAAAATSGGVANLAAGLDPAAVTDDAGSLFITADNFGGAVASGADAGALTFDPLLGPPLPTNALGAGLQTGDLVGNSGLLVDPNSEVPGGLVLGGGSTNGGGGNPLVAPTGLQFGNNGAPTNVFGGGAAPTNVFGGGSTLATSVLGSAGGAGFDSSPTGAANSVNSFSGGVFSPQTTGDTNAVTVNAADTLSRSGAVLGLALAVFGAVVMI